MITQKHPLYLCSCLCIKDYFKNACYFYDMVRFLGTYCAFFLEISRIEQIIFLNLSFFFLLFSIVWCSHAFGYPALYFRINSDSIKMFLHINFFNVMKIMPTLNVSAVDSVYILEKGVSWSKMIRNSILVPTFLIFFETPLRWMSCVQRKVCTIRWYFLHLCYIVYFLITTWTIWV